MDAPALAARMRAQLGPHSVLTDRRQLRTYECDGLAHYRSVPALVVLPETSEQVVHVVRVCAEEGVPWVARGSGTGLSGGALPLADGVLVVLSRMREIVEVDLPNRRAIVQPGVVNLWVTREVAPYGWYYAPDPSSEQVCSIGGNVAENSGGAHCLKYGFTTNHVTGAEVVLPSAEVVHLGGKAPDPVGYDLLGAFVGSEGTLGIATQVTVRLSRAAEHVETLLLGFASIEDAGAAVSATIAAGIVPAAVEMMDRLAIEAAEAAVRCGYPAGAEAVLVVELDGPADDVAAELTKVRALAEANGAFEIRVATSPEQRALIWKGRKSAFAAVGRISPDFYVQDGVIPRTELPAVLGRIDALARDRAMRVANVFHAGDGNLHPLVLFDGRVDGAEERAREVACGILDICLDVGGSITGEHGVGHDKVAYMGRQFTPDDLDTMQRLRCAFDPSGLANPGKVFPTPRLCGELPGSYRARNASGDAGLAEVF